MRGPLWAATRRKTPSVGLRPRLEQIATFLDIYDNKPMLALRSRRGQSMLSDEIVVQRSRWHIAALRVEVKLLHLGLVLRAYDPGQPRVPAGHQDGGRWTSEDGSGGFGTDDDTRLIRVGSDDDRKYKVDLRTEEGRGGHTMGRHVGKSDDELFEKVRKSQWRTLFSNGGDRRDGSFSSIDSANSLVNNTIEENRSKVDLVASGSLDSVFIKKNSVTRQAGRHIAMMKVSCICEIHMELASI